MMNDTSNTQGYRIMKENENNDALFADNEENYEALLSEIDEELMDELSAQEEQTIDAVVEDIRIDSDATVTEDSSQTESNGQSDSLIDAFLSEQNGDVVFEENVPFETDEENLNEDEVESETDITDYLDAHEDINSDYVNNLIDGAIREIESEMLANEQISDDQTNESIEAEINNNADSTSTEDAHNLADEGIDFDLDEFDSEKIEEQSVEDESQQTESIKFDLDDQIEEPLVEEEQFEVSSSVEADNSGGIDFNELDEEEIETPTTNEEPATAAEAIEFDLDSDLNVDVTETLNETESAEQDITEDETVQLHAVDEAIEEVEEVEADLAEEINEVDNDVDEEEAQDEGLEFDLDGYDLDETQPETIGATTQAAIDPHTYNRQQIEYGSQTPSGGITQAVDVAQPQVQKATAFGPAQSAPVAGQQGPGLLSSLGSFFMSHVKHGAATINSKLLQSTVNAQDQQLKNNGAVLDKVVDTFLAKQEGHLSKIEQNSENLTDNLKATMNKDFQEFLDMGFEGDNLNKTQRERFENIGNRASTLSTQDDLLNDDLKERLSELAEKVKELIKSLFKKNDDQSLAQS